MLIGKRRGAKGDGRARDSLTPRDDVLTVIDLFSPERARSVSTIVSEMTNTDDLTFPSGTLRQLVEGNDEGGGRFEVVGRASRGGTSTRARVPPARVSNPGEHDVRRRHPAHARRVARGEDLRARRSRNGPRRRRGPARRRDVVDVAPALAGRVARLPRTTQHPRRTRSPAPRRLPRARPLPPRARRRARPRRHRPASRRPVPLGARRGRPRVRQPRVRVRVHPHQQTTPLQMLRRRLLPQVHRHAPAPRPRQRRPDAKSLIRRRPGARLPPLLRARARRRRRGGGCRRRGSRGGHEMRRHITHACRHVTRERAPTRRRRRMRGEDETEGAAVDDARVLRVSLRARAHRGVRARPGRVRPRRYTPCRSARRGCRSERRG